MSVDALLYQQHSVLICLKCKIYILLKTYSNHTTSERSEKYVIY